MNRTKQYIASAVAALVASVLLPSISRATPYASGLTNSGGTISFFLNEDADNVKVIFNGGASTNDLGAKTRGKYSFSLGANTSYKIEVSKTSGAGYRSGSGTNATKLQISSDTEHFLNFERPMGLEINKNPASPYFGRIYVGNIRSSSTALGRSMQPGIYMVNPDYSSAHAPGQEEQALRPSNLPIVVPGSSTNLFPYDFTIGADDRLYICDATDLSGNLWVANADVSDSGSAVLKLISATGDAKCPVTAANTHGSILAAHVEGSLGNNLVVWTIDEDLQLDKTTTNKTQLNSLWRYDIGSSAVPYASDASAKVWTASGKQGINFSAQLMDMCRSTNGNFYIVDTRSAGGESGLTVVSAAGTALWNSYDATGTTVDILANAQKVAVSPDDKYIAVSRATGGLWIMPLTNGIPDLSQRKGFLPYGSTSSALRGLCFDAAGNLYVDSNSSEMVIVFSPGGTTIATTTSDGKFSVSAPATTATATTSTPSILESAGNNAGVFTITRTGDTSVPLTVNYAISGTASNSTDYTTVATGTVTISAFQSSTNIFITPVDDSTAELTETVTLTVLTGTGYAPAIPTSATVSILDNETPELSIQAVQPNLLECYATAKSTHQIIRRGLLTSPLTANISYSGTATRNVDYAGPSTVSIAANVVSTNFVLTAINDQTYEGNETAIATIVSGSGYVIGTNSSSTTTVVDDEYPAGTVLFSDDFETDSSANWIVNQYDANNSFAEFGYDYSQVGIPAPLGTVTRKGLRLRCGNAISTPQTDAICVSPVGGNFTGNYRLKFNMWINYNGPLPDGGPGSTQNASAGVGTIGTKVEWPNNGFADGIWFGCTGDGADGFNGGDYNAFIGPDLQNDNTGFYAAGTGNANSGLRDEANAYYSSLWGGVTAPAEQLSLFSGQTGIANSGNAGMAWHTVVITKLDNTVTWTIDGMPIASITNDLSGLANNIFVGYYDIFAGTRISDVPQMSFVLYDNLRVETYSAAPPAAPIITGVARSGSNLVISFTAGASDQAGDFTVVGSSTLSNVSGDYTPVGASITGSSGSFQATVSIGSGANFFRIKR